MTMESTASTSEQNKTQDTTSNTGDTESVPPNANSGSGVDTSKQEASWRDTLPEDLKGEKTFETIKDVPTLAKSYLEARKSIGNSLRVPGKDATKEQVDEFYTKIGWEADAKKVNIKGPIMPPGMEMKPEEVDSFKGVAHSLRMTEAQMQGVMNYFGEVVTKVVPNYKEDSKKAVETLQKDWGAAIDRNMGVARRATITSFPKETVARITQSGLANDVGFIKAMFEVGRGMIEEGAIPEEIGQGVDENSAKAKIAEMESDAKSPLWDKSNPRHDEFVQKRAGLYKVLYPAKGE